MTEAVEAFIARWRGSGGGERGNYQLFLDGLADLLGVDRPQPHAADARDDAYVFERRVTFRHGDGSESHGFIDLYRRGCFVCEAKKLRQNADTRGFDAAMLRARSQAEAYARALPVEEGRPPFVVVVDVGQRIELYAEFSRSGATYTPFPDPRSHRIALDDLRRDDIRERLRRVWLDPLSLDPSRESARVTREIAARLAELAKSLERAGHPPESVAQFLMRCLFTMFAEDVRLLPEDSLLGLLQRHRESPDVAMRMLAQLWRDMDAGGFSAVLAGNVLRFNGKLFKQPDVLPLDRDQIDLLLQAARADWRHVEPAIFGTLLERALSPDERHKLGAHYTPRAYVERLVLPTVIEPLRAEWSDAQAAALTLAAEGKADEAAVELQRFHHRLCGVRVLDPACGSGNFLYVTLEHLKRLEGEVLNALDELGYRQSGLALGGERADATAGETVDPHNLLGIEINPRAAAIAEVVLWIGYLQWHFRTRGDIHPPQPVIRDFRNIECRDAVLAYDAVEYVTDERGVPVTRWDGKTTKPSPVTGEPIPDDAARVPLERYVNPRKAAWPAADFVVGNPPFIGNKRMRLALGDGYVEALRGAWTDVPDSADFVMYWWHHAAQLTRRGALQRFGLITTNSISQSFNRRIVEAALSAKPAAPSTSRSTKAQAGRDTPGASSQRKPQSRDHATTPSFQRKLESSLSAGPDLDSSVRWNDGMTERPLSLVFAIPDHPWVDATDGAAVRIAMTVAALAHSTSGRLLEVHREDAPIDGEVPVDLAASRGEIQADLSVGAKVVGALKLRANAGLCFQGVKLVGDGFRLGESRIGQFQLSEGAVLREYWTGRDLTKCRQSEWVIDFHGLGEEVARRQYPKAFQEVLTKVKPARDQVARASHRERWWVFGEPRPGMRRALHGLSRYIATSEVAKHRLFVLLDWPRDLPDGSIMVIASADAPLHLGVLSSVIHQRWSLAAGGRMGAGNDPRYNSGKCFLPFPFPSVTEAKSRDIRTLAEHLDTHRKRQQAAHPGLTLTGMYNVLEKLRSGEPLSAKERVIHEQGLVSVLRQIHDELDAAVLDAYGWSDLLPLLRIAHGNDAPPPVVGAAMAATGDAARSVAAVADPTVGSNPASVAVGATASAIAMTRDDAKRAFDEAILERLVALNAERAAEEARGLVRWLRPEFQNKQAQAAPEQTELDATSDDDTPDTVAAPAAKPQPWPKDTLAQVRAVADVLAASPRPLDLDAIAARFTARGPWKKRLPQLLDILVALGRARATDGGYAAV